MIKNCVYLICGENEFESSFQLLIYSLDLMLFSKCFIPKFDFFFVFSVLHQIAGCSNYPKVIDLPVINLNLNFKVALVRLAK